MRRRHALLVVALLAGLALPLSVHGADPLSPAELIDKDGQEVTVEFVVRSVGRAGDGNPELYSQPTWSDPGTAFVRLLPGCVAELRAAGMNDLATHFKDRPVRVAEAFRTHSRRLFKDVAVKTLLDKEATRANLLAELDGLRGRARPGDVAVVFYAGHGAAPTGGAFHLLPVDADPKDIPRTGIPTDDLREKLRLPCSTLLILDACFSGAVDQRPAGGKRKRSLPEAADRGVRELVYDEGLVVFCGAAKDQEAAEENGRGYFTAALVEGLSGKAADDGLVDILDLQKYVHRRVQKLSDGSQTPTFSVPSTVRPFALAKP